MSEQRKGFLPPLWSATLAEQIFNDHGPILRWYAAEARRRDVELRREHPWRWRAVHARRWARRRWHALARLTPVRWVGFGHDWPGRWEW